MNGSGLSLGSSNPYDPFNGPKLAGAKLSPLSLAGDYPPVGFGASVANHGVEYYGSGEDLYRLRLFTSGGFSPDGVSGLLPQEFERFFVLEARRAGGGLRRIRRAGRPVTVKGGRLEVLGIADLGTGLGADPAYTYAEDHDNQFDIIVRASSPEAAAALRRVILPDPRSGTHSPLYNPGAPARTLCRTRSTPSPAPARCCGSSRPCGTRPW